MWIVCIMTEARCFKKPDAYCYPISHIPWGEMVKVILFKILVWGSSLTSDFKEHQPKYPPKWWNYSNAISTSNIGNGKGGANFSFVKIPYFVSFLLLWITILTQQVHFHLSACSVILFKILLLFQLQNTLPSREILSRPQHLLTVHLFFHKSRSSSCWNLTQQVKIMHPQCRSG